MYMYIIKFVDKDSICKEDLFNYGPQLLASSNTNTLLIEYIVYIYHSILM